MNTNIVNEISTSLKINASQVDATLNLLKADNTIPFIARYRKEVTGSLDEEQIRQIATIYEYEVNLLKRKEDVIRLIDEKGMLTVELKSDILNCKKLIEVEDLYRPYKEKKKTKATEAIKLGLEPLSKYILNYNENVLEEASKYITDQVLTADDAIIHAKYIIAEIISDDANIRKFLRNNLYNFGIIKSKKKKNAVDEKKTFEIYYDYSEKISQIKPHRILAVNRGENENVLTVGLDIDKDNDLLYISNHFIKGNQPECVKLINEAIIDSYNRLIFPSLERDVRSELKEIGEASAIDNFALNLENLLLTPPMKEKVVLGFDPAYRTGCKLAVVDSNGKLLTTTVIYPTEPHNKIVESEKTLLELIDKYNVEIISIGNGTASRESEKFVAETIKKAKVKVEYIIVNEAGASVYSASEEAAKEFPDLTVEKRSAISIARRLQDSLSELVKIDPKSIGVGLYQHDVSEKELDESLSFIVTKVVNQVGVNLNTSSKSILKYISGLNNKVINSIYENRETNGRFNSRNDLLKIKGVSAKVYEQAAGFLRIDGGSNPLDKTAIHPESYSLAEQLLKELNCMIDDIGSKKIIDIITNTNIIDLSNKLGVDKVTVTDIMNNFKKPNLDPRDNMPKPLLKSDILNIEDLSIGMKLNGTVRNVVDFGAFIDIGLHNDGLAHISKLSNKFINHPSEVVGVGDIVDCYVIDISIEKEKVSLSLLDINQKREN